MQGFQDRAVVGLDRYEALDQAARVLGALTAIGSDPFHSTGTDLTGGAHAREVSALLVAACAVDVSGDQGVVRRSIFRCQPDLAGLVVVDGGMINGAFRANLPTKRILRHGILPRQGYSQLAGIGHVAMSVPDSSTAAIG